MSVSPVVFLKDVLYGDKNSLKGKILHLLNADKKYRALLCTILYKYHDVLLGLFPTQAPINRKLRDIHEILLVEGAMPIGKSMYRHSP